MHQAHRVIKIKKKKDVPWYLEVAGMIILAGITIWLLPIALLAKLAEKTWNTSHKEG